MRIDILTLFPEVFQPYASTSILGRATSEKHIDLHIWNIRDFTEDLHKTVDDTPYGGGAGMVMKIEPIHKALQAIEVEHKSSSRKIFVLSARGQQFNQQLASDYSKIDHMILICGRYEGIDQRVADYLADGELSVGPYVLAGGELGALVVTEAVARLLPGVLGNPLSLQEESHSTEGVIEAPQYTKPEIYNSWKVPDVLLSGNHADIAAWRKNSSL
ncbi:MAG TPA: tRNA (guanosine(37)-N1)-methyltransferase TrmD [Candidatus Andersenbacteria bacterium]|nr:tRNA (guanosine(37)-N1)-methyltransferase TrmD [Candidatus Andersenbacteria bacterium]